MKETTISIKVLNELLSEEQRNKYLINEENGHQGIPDNDSEGYQGEYNETFHYYQHPEMPKNIFLKTTTHTDSYGYNKSIVEYQFVEGKKEQITVYKPV